jgi:two-component system, OmpR family, copper resistance phosphate regulon response regulator CusR
MAIRVLIVEDEAAIADFVVRGLREEGFTVEWVDNGNSALERLSDERWDVVCLDWWIPGCDGLEVLRRLRSTDRETPVLFLTARDAISDRVAGLDSGADDYLCKPFAFEEYLARVRALSRRRSRTGSTTLVYGDVVVDLVTHSVRRAGKSLSLTAKEYSLLAFFLRRPGEVLSRTRIYDRVWDDRFDGLSNTLEVHVMELRRKLESRGPRLIHTLRGRGYIFGESSSDDSTT